LAAKLNKMNEDYLISQLGEYVAERYALVPSEALKLIGDSDWPAIRKALRQWQEHGYLDILADPEFASPYEPCIRLKNFITAKTPLDPFWVPLREEMPPYYEKKRREYDAAKASKVHEAE
jgi:hypothetical protein